MKLLTKKFDLLIRIIITGLLFLSLFLLQINSPMVGYDYFILNCPHGRGLIYLLNEIKKSILYWNGRSSQIVGFIIGFFPRYVFWIINSFIIILFIYLVYYYCFSEEENNNKYMNIILTLLIVLSYILYLFPATFDVFFWMPGACNHLWSTVATLLFLIPYYKTLYNKNFFENKKKKVIILYIISAFIIGASLENIFAFGFIFILYTLFISFKNKKISIWQIGAFISYICGAVYLFLLSSTEYRKTKFLNGTHIIQSGIKKISYVLESFIAENKIFLFIILLSIVIYFCYLKINRKKINYKFKNIIIMYVLSFASLFIFYFSPYYSSRAMLIISFFGLVLVIYVLSNMIISKKIIVRILCLLLCILNIYAYIYFFRVYYISNKFINIRNNKIASEANLNYDKIDFDLVPCHYDGTRVIEYKEFINPSNPKDNNNYDADAIKRYYNISKNKQFKFNDKYNKAKDYCININHFIDPIGNSTNKIQVKYEIIGKQNIK